MAHDPELTIVAKIRLAFRIVVSGAVVKWGLSRVELPDLVRRLGSTAPRTGATYPPRWLGRVVVRVLSPVRARCIVNALVLYHLLRAQGDEPTLVIGLPSVGPTRDAHAWIEVAGADVGPPPGRSAHAELARYPDALR